MTHVKTSPYYPQSNGKIERWHQSLKMECIRPRTPLSLEDARKIVEEFVRYYNEKRLHSAIGYIAPIDKLEGREKAILADRERKLDEARARRKQKRLSIKNNLTGKEGGKIVSTVGETEVVNAGKQTARDSRSGFWHKTSEGTEPVPFSL